MPRLPPPEHSRWKPGQSGNPKGRPKRKSFETLVEEILDEKLPGPKGARKKVKRELLARVFVDELLKRNNGLVREYLSRAWPVVQHHDVTQRTDTDGASLAARLTSVTAARKGNGHDTSPDALREEDAQ